MPNYTVKKAQKLLALKFNIPGDTIKANYIQKSFWKLINLNSLRQGNRCCLIMRKEGNS